MSQHATLQTPHMKIPQHDTYDNQLLYKGDRTDDRQLMIKSGNTHYKQLICKYHNTTHITTNPCIKATTQMTDNL